MPFYSGGTIHGNYVFYYKTNNGWFKGNLCAKTGYNIGLGDYVYKGYDKSYMLIPCWEAFEAAS